MPKLRIAPILQTFLLLVLFLPVSGYAEKVKNMDDLFQKLSKAGLKPDVFKSEIQEALKGINSSYQRSKQREIHFEDARDLFPISPKYISISFDAKIGLRGAGIAGRKKDSIVSTLFRRTQGGKINLVSYLVWSGNDDIKEYKGLDVEKLCKLYREFQQVADCVPTKQVLAKGAVKNAKYFAISGDDITSGVVKEEFIDDILTRDYELQNAKQEFYSKDHIDQMSERLVKLENILVGKEQAEKDREDHLKNKLSKLSSKLEATGSMSERIKKMEQDIARLEKSLDRLVAIFAGVSRKGDTIIFSKANVSIVNGTGKSEGQANGLGNLIVGYNDTKKVEISKVSHNVVIGGHSRTQGKNVHFGSE